MGATIIEKILARASGKKKVSAGDRVWANVDLATMRDFGGPNVVQEYKNAFGNKKVWDGSKVAITFDLHLPPKEEKHAQNQQACRKFAKEMGAKLFDVNSGVGQHILYEHGLVHPWDVIIGTDSHMNLLGVFGAFATGVGSTDVAATFAYGKLWYKVPETHKYIVNGKLQKYTSAKDVILHILKNVKTDGAIYKAIEFEGSTIDKMNLAGRITLASMITEISGKIGFIAPSKEIMDEIDRRTGKKNEPISADKDANYEKVIEFDVDKLEPQIACPHSPDNVKAVREVAGRPVDQVFIGSCTNGRYDDMEAAAKILKGKTIAPGVRLIIVPSTMEVAKKVVENGLHKIFLDAGAVVPNPSCALCTIGHPGVLAPGEVMVSTSNRNFPGKIGKGGEIYLSSPEVAAATAIKGKITDPRDV